MNDIAKWTPLILGIGLWFSIEPGHTGIRGSVSPSQAVVSVWLVAGKDTMKTTPSMGVFSFEVKPGVCKIIVDANSPYKDMILEAVTVEEGRMKDIGELVLEKNIP